MSITKVMATPHNQIYRVWDMEGIGDRVRARRSELGKSQTWLAKKIGKTQPAVVKLEKGGKAGTRDILALAEALDVSPHWLKTGEGPQSREAWMDRINRLAPKALVLLDSYLGFLEKNESE